MGWWLFVELLCVSVHLRTYYYTWCSRSWAIVARLFKITWPRGRIGAGRCRCRIHYIIIPFFLANQWIAKDAIIPGHADANYHHDDCNQTPCRQSSWIRRTRTNFIRIVYVSLAWTIVVVVIVVVLAGIIVWTLTVLVHLMLIVSPDATFRMMNHCFEWNNYEEAWETPKLDQISSYLRFVAIIKKTCFWPLTQSECAGHSRTHTQTQICVWAKTNIKRNTHQWIQLKQPTLDIYACFFSRLMFEMNFGDYYWTMGWMEMWRRWMNGCSTQQTTQSKTELCVWEWRMNAECQVVAGSTISLSINCQPCQPNKIKMQRVKDGFTSLRMSTRIARKEYLPLAWHTFNSQPINGISIEYIRSMRCGNLLVIRKVHTD